MRNLGPVRADLPLVRLRVRIHRDLKRLSERRPI
jgi:hypothetical protein